MSEQAILCAIAVAVGYFALKKTFADERFSEGFFKPAFLGALFGAGVSNLIFWAAVHDFDDIFTQPFLWSRSIARDGAVAGILIFLFVHIKRHKNVPLLSILDRLSIAAAWFVFALHLDIVIIRGHDLTSDLQLEALDIDTLRAMTYLLVAWALSIAYGLKAVRRKPGLVMQLFLTLMFFGSAVLLRNHTAIFGKTLNPILLSLLGLLTGFLSLRNWLKTRPSIMVRR